MIPEATITSEGKTIGNLAHSVWLEIDQRVLLLQSSITDEFMVEVLGHTISRSFWCALESAYSHASKERAQNLKDSLLQLRKGDSSVSEFAIKFKSLCDQLAAIGQPVSVDDKSHWFLCGLGPAFETFSTTYRTVQPTPPYCDLLAQEEGHELFIRSLHGNFTPHATFTPSHQYPTTSPNSSRGHGRSGRGGRVGYFGGRCGRGGRPPHCQLCRNDGHYANTCP